MAGPLIYCTMARGMQSTAESCTKEEPLWPRQISELCARITKSDFPSLSKVLQQGSILPVRVFESHFSFLEILEMQTI